jgi:hypothetical protein
MIALSLLLLCACGKDIEDWWTVNIGYSEDTADTTETEEVDTGPLADQRSLIGELVQVRSGVEVSLQYLLVEDAEIQCDMRYTAEKVRQIDCEVCLIAFSIYQSEGTIAAEIDGRCTEEGWDRYDGVDIYVGLDSIGSAYQCTEGCTSGEGTWSVAGSAEPNDAGFEFTIDL